MYGSFFNAPGSVFADLDRLQRQMQQTFGLTGRPGSIRAVANGAFPAVNVGSTPTAIEVYAFAPGLDSSQIDVQVDRGVLTIAGERPADTPEGNEKAAVYANERFSGRFKRTVSLPEDADPQRVEAHYKNGVLHVTVMRRESTQPKRIKIK